MEKKQNTFNKVMKTVKNSFIRLFGFGKQKEALDEELIIKSENDKKEKSLKEEEILSPGKQIFKKFIKNRIAITGVIMFLTVILFIVIGSSVISFDAAYLEPSQQYIEPGLGYTSVPKGLQREGIKVIVDEKGEKNYLIDGGTAFTVAISNKNKIYVWGANIDKVKKVPNDIKDKAADIVQLSVGSRHAVALTKNGEFLAWGSNGFEQSQIPVYNELTDSGAPHKKTIEAYFKPEARTKYYNDVATKIEEDPIKEVFAGDQFTVILTESSRVYAWGVIKTIGLDQPESSYKAYQPKFRYSNGFLSWRYNIESSSAFDLEERKVFSYDELVEKFGLIEEEGATLELRYSISGTTSKLQYRNFKGDNSEKWLDITITVDGKNKDIATEADFATEIADKMTTSIVDIHVLYEHVVYELNDNRFVLVGVPGLITDDYPAVLSQTEQERGYRIEKIVGTLKNAFYLDENGKVFGWGASSTANILNNVGDKFDKVNIVDLDAGSYHLTLLDDAGKVYTYGYNNVLGHLDMPNNLKDSEKVFANYFVSLAVQKNGKIRSWGNNGYLFGTDAVGADVLKRVVAGGTMTLSVAVIAVVVSLVIGLTVGLVAGFYGKWLDNLLMRLAEIISAFPFLPLAMTLASIVHTMGLGEKERIFLIMAILGLLSWPGLARLVRGQILAEREKDYIMAAKSLGIKERHIILRHILPNVVNVVIVNTTLSYAGALLTESGLSFLGFGIMYPQPSWGNMLTGAQSMTTLRNYWWLWIIPAMFIILTALSVNLVGDGLREAMDPKSSER